MTSCLRAGWWVAPFAIFGMVAVGEVGAKGWSGDLTWPGLAFGMAGAAVLVWLGWCRFQRYRRLDELQQRVELEALATAFIGSFAVFAAYWLLHIAGLFPPMEGTAFIFGMILLVTVGRGGALRRLFGRPAAP